MVKSLILPSVERIRASEGNEILPRGERSRRLDSDGSHGFKVDLRYDNDTGKSDVNQMRHVGVRATFP